MIDTHAHVYAAEFKNDLADVIQKAKEAGVNQVLLPNIDSESIEALNELVKNYPDFFRPMMGLHPCSVKDNYKTELSIIESELDKQDCIAVGEIGIDLYWDTSTRDLQIEAFKIQCQWAIDRNLPVAIHSRESTDLIIGLIDKHFKGELAGVFHCFTGDLSQAQKIVELGMYMGIGGVYTFKNSSLRDFISEVPLDRLILETDSPYLAPVPFRGKRNEPSYVKYVLESMAETLGMQASELDQVLEANSLNLFKI